MDQNCYTLMVKVMKKDKKTKLSGSKNTDKSWELFGIRLFGGGMNEVLKWAERRRGRKTWIATVNPEFVMKALKDRDFMEILQSRTDLNVVDGIGLVWAEKLKVYKVHKACKGIKIGWEILRGRHREGLVPGVDLMKELCGAGNGFKPFRTKKVFFLGGWGDRAARTARNLINQLRITNYELKCDWSEGEPTVNNEEVVKKINDFKPDLLFVAYGMGKQEKWIRDNLEKIEVGLVMGVGRSFDYYSGDLPRAPEWVRRMGMEWLYSLIKEPKRWRRQVELVRFLGMVVGNGFKPFRTMG